MTFQEIRQRLQNVKKNGAGYTALCPAHTDKQNSLSISEKSDKIVLYCHAHCSVNDICAALGIGLKDLFLTNGTSNGRAGYNQQGRIVAAYQYKDEAGTLLYENVRFEPKDFRQRHFDNNGKEIWNLNGTRRVPYRLPELIAALRDNPNEIVYLTEGEKDCDKLREQGFTASSFKNWKPEFNELIKDADVVLLVDHDRSGLRQANEAAKIIQPAARTLKLIDLFENEELPEKHGRDVSDWLELGRTAAELKGIIENVSVWTAAHVSTDLSEPIPLPKDRLPAPELNERLLPDAWREWLTDVSERLQCPPDYAAVSALVASASLIGNRIRIRPKRLDSWLVVPNLWGAIVGVPGVMKTPAVNEGLIFFREIAEIERLKFEKLLESAEFEKEFNDAKKATLKKDMAKAKAGEKEKFKQQFMDLQVDEPKEKRLWTSDTTVEKLGELLNENPEGMLILRDELTGWSRMLDRSGHEQDRSFYLETWNGEGSFVYDRIGRGKIYIKNLTVSILGTIQPAMIKPYLRGTLEGSGDDGLIQRFQALVYPETPKTYRYVDSLPKGRAAAREAFRNLYSIKPQDIKAKRLTDEDGGHYFLQFDNEAQEFFQSWLTDLENDLRSDTFDTAALESHLAKYRSLMPTLALIFHLLDYVSGKQSEAISLDNATRAAAWCGYFQSHAARIYQIASLSEFDIAREILKRIQSKSLDTEFTARDIYGKHWSKLSKPKDVQDGLEILTDYGYLTAQIINEGHRPKTVYFVHESLR